MGGARSLRVQLDQDLEECPQFGQPKQKTSGPQRRGSGLICICGCCLCVGLLLVIPLPKHRYQMASEMPSGYTLAVTPGDRMCLVQG